MKKKILILLGCFVLLNSCKSEIEDTAERSPDQISTHEVNGTTVHELMINGNLTYVNETDGQYFFADDVIISPEQFNYLKQLAAGGSSNAGRSTIAKSFVRTWPDGIIYYRIPDQGSLSNANYEMFRTNLDSAFNMISSRTNLEFIERNNQAEYLHFQNSTVNNSPLGWRASMSNTINIYNYDMPAVIAHEVMHSMGIMHEQCRPDRDEHAIVNINRALPNASMNFNIDPTMAGYGDFDFGSVMMYGPTDFAINPALPVITRLDGSLFTRQRVRLSDGDYAGINHLYGPVSNGIVGVYNFSSALGSGLNIASQRDGADWNKINIILAQGTASSTQKFILRKSDHGSYIIKSVWDATKVLTISGTANGSTVELRRNTNGNDQKWKLYNLGNDGYSFEPLNASGLRLEVRNGQTANGTLLVIGTDQSNPTTGEVPDRQRFNLNNAN